MSEEYALYQKLGGALSEQEFDTLRQQAQAQLDYYTSGRASGELNAYQRQKVLQALAALALQAERDSQTAFQESIASETVGPHSVSYRAPKSELQKRQETAALVRMYLSGTGLLYSGLQEGGNPE